MVSAEYISNLSESEVGKLLDYVYCNMTGVGDGIGSLTRLDLLNGNRVSTADRRQYSLYKSIVLKKTSLPMRYNYLGGKIH